MTAASSTVFIVETAALQRLLAEKDAEIARLKDEIVRLNGDCAMASTVQDCVDRSGPYSNPID